jgi:hypothetical protein
MGFPPRGRSFLDLAAIVARKEPRRNRVARRDVAVAGSKPRAAFPVNNRDQKQREQCLRADNLQAQRHFSILFRCGKLPSRRLFFSCYFLCYFSGLQNSAARLWKSKSPLRFSAGLLAQLPIVPEVYTNRVTCQVTN